MLVGIQDEILRLHSMGLLKQLLADKTTKTNIIWATDAYQELGADYQRDKEMQAQLITGQNSDVIKTRARKAMEQQSERTRKHAEVFTPICICHNMVSYADAVWFGEADAFLNGEQPTGRVQFPKRRRWQHYVDARRLEITSTGEGITLQNRQGILDRKLRIVSENAADEAEWLKWALRAFQATYGYEFQGDNLLIARVNLLMTFEEYLYAQWKRKPTAAEYRQIVKTIVWNIWQMDGLSGTIPYCKTEEEFHQVGLFEWFDSEEYQEKANQQPHCRIYDWRRENSLEYQNVNKGGRNMKFDFVIGNPPYQDETIGDNDTYAPPIYNHFMDEAYKIGEKVELIHPARFLFNAGSTPKAWNQKMLHDPHFKIIHYESDSGKVFFNTDIKGGIVISYRDCNEDFGAIDTFTPYDELNSILGKVRKSDGFVSFSTIIVTSYAYHFSEQLYIDFPKLRGALSKGHEFDLKSNVFEKMPEAFFEEKPQDGKKYIRILGRINNERHYKYILEDYVKDVINLHYYKVFLPGATGTGQYGETIALPFIGVPGDGSTETFLSIGKFELQYEAENVAKYIKCKFTRAMFGILKRTQANTPGKWQCVPLQDFTSTSDIDWSKSIAEIDRQLYVKYGLDEDEVAFIESHVKEMV